MSDDLFAAIEQHDLDRIASLLAAGADPNATMTRASGWRPLHAAIEELEFGGPIEALILLLRSGAIVDGWDAAHQATPLLMALFRAQPEAVRICLGVGADVTVVGSEGDSPLRWSAEHGDHDMVAMLLRCGAGATIDQAGGITGLTALGHAARRLDVLMVELLLGAGADPHAVDADYGTARQRMPARNAANGQVWDAVMALLNSPSSTP